MKSSFSTSTQPPESFFKMAGLGSVGQSGSIARAGMGLQGALEMEWEVPVSARNWRNQEHTGSNFCYVCLQSLTVINYG